MQWTKQSQWIYDYRQHDFFLSFGLKKKYRSLEEWAKTFFFLCWSIFCESDLNCFVCCVYDSRTGEEKVYEFFICFPSVKTWQEKIFFSGIFHKFEKQKKKKKRLWQKRFSLVSVVKMGITILTYNKTKTKIIILPLPLRAYVKKPTGCHVKWLAASELKLQLAKCLTKREPVSQLLIDHLDVTQYEAQSQI